MKPLFAILALVVSTGAQAESCPPPPDHGAAIAALLAQVREAGTEMEARVLTNELWGLWADAPDERAQAVLDSGMRKRESFDLRGAIEEFDRLIAYCPDYAEGYNQRAFALFIAQDYGRALADLDRAIALQPQHVAAMAGRALTLMGLERSDEAQAELRAVLKIHPWLPERRMLVETDTEL
ncbi:hypothetical protein ATO6_21415 [Oceanicola sp. 22II-s10i]|uniref:tetratricopeptide repeat protein n=1 Tax=Oceanicola sp. 22II-s10i TaxID=1317116 RepID=UPI000B5254A1|nr:tetratricopeptide repeat protein [Oceanicola sp. 22II-s10i]OWU82873.1 hypothetical protein ATO6_21415 [Oceanicola sp. 22II-s10i]